MILVSPSLRCSQGLSGVCLLLYLSNRLIKKLEHSWKSLIHDGVSVFVPPVTLCTCQ